jgi:uncharacterized protein
MPSAMPVRFSTSSVARWPERATVEAAARAWAAGEAARRPELLRLGCFGSYARGEPGPGSDLDLVAVVRESAFPFERRALEWDLLGLPVAAEILVYTEREWGDMQRSERRFARVLREETVWLFERRGPEGGAAANGDSP